MKQRIRVFFAQFGSSVLLLGVCAYLVLQLMLGIGEVVDVDHTSYATVQDTLQLDAYVFRDETPLYSGTTGTNCYLVDNGERVAVGSTVALTYSAATDASVQERITRIDRMIRILEQSNLSAGALTTDLTILDRQIENMTVELLREISDDALDKALRGEEALWVQLNRRQALLGSSTSTGSYSARINLLLQEKADLNRSLTGTPVSVATTTPGYFYNAVDGYETQFSITAMENLTLDGLQALAHAEPDSAILQNACGKMAASSYWGLAVSTDKRTASAYESGRYYDILFPYSGGIQLSMKLERKVVQTDREDAILVFSSRDLPEGFDFSRSQTVELVAGTYSGIRVDVDALRLLDGELGCYVLNGTQVVFKKADVIYRNEEFVICNVPYNSIRGNREDKAYVSEEYISLYDAVILSGKNLYVGKVLQ